ncbi:MAG: response regulator transcription factor [Oscillospiraceae bacterium]|nr:response regulator transcription factor [Oscillospiraceae bacterium]
MAVILIVEDDKNTQLLTAARLRPHFDILCANDGLEALDIVYDKHIDLIVSDIMMPDMDGYELVKRLRSEGYETPIILLTAKQAFEDKRDGFDSGSDDYLTKPVNYDELLLRINALLRRAKIATDRRIAVGSLTVDASTYSVIYNHEAVTLSKKEFDLLFKLLSYPNVIFTKNQLLDEIWGFDSESTEDTVKTHISRLRGKLSGCDELEIITVKGIGYKAEIKKGIKDG